MIAERSLIFATLLFGLCVLTVRSQGNSVIVLFAESDASGMESESMVTAPVRVQGDNTESFTLIAIPLTVAQYRADPGSYRNSCDAIILDPTDQRSTDTAEESDFNGQPVEIEILSNATDDKGRLELDVSIALVSDTIREPDEYFLLVLDAHQLPSAVDRISFTSDRNCIGVTITADQDPFSIEYVSLINPIIVSEDAGSVQIIRVEKQGQIEESVDVTFSGFDPSVFTVSPASLTLQPEQTFAIVSINLIDNQIAGDDNITATISAGSQFGSDLISIVIKENDRVLVGFDQTEVTVIEGEQVSLSTSFKNGITIDTFLRSEQFFHVLTQQGRGNATVSRDYRNFSTVFYFVNDPIEIQTFMSDELETPRQFKVKMTYPVSTPLVVIEPDTVLVTIRDRNGAPNVPVIVDVQLTKDDITISWELDRHDLRPVHTYGIKIQITGSRNQDSDTDSDSVGDLSRAEILEFNSTTSAANTKCNTNATKDQCVHILTREFDVDKSHNVTICATNDIGTTCGNSVVVMLRATPLNRRPGGRLPTGLVLGIVFGVVAAVLLCCLLWAFIALIVCCCVCEREKVYDPEKKERENEKLREIERYNRVATSESPVNEYYSKDYYY